MQDIALFPFIEPVFASGRTEVLVSEPHLQRMIKESLQATRAFALVPIDKEQDPDAIRHLSPLATLTNVIDFNQDAKGRLSVTVEGVQLIKIHQIHREHDNLLYADATLLPNWPTLEIKPQHQFIQQHFINLYQESPELRGLYPELPKNDLNWYALRWLELLPLNSKHRQLMVHHHSAELLIFFLTKLFNEASTSHD